MTKSNNKNNKKNNDSRRRLSNLLRNMYNRNIPSLLPVDLQQQFNVLCHREPYSYICYVLYWSFILLFVTPFIGMILLWMGVYETTRYLIYPRRRIIQPNSSSDDNKDTKDLAIIITNTTDTEFGNELVRRLAEEGFVVFAGSSTSTSTSSSSKKMEMKKKLTKMNTSSGRVIPLVLDVTKEDDVHGAYQTVQNWLTAGDSNTTTNKRQRYLHALIIMNNNNNNKTNTTRKNNENFEDNNNTMDLSLYRNCMEDYCFGSIRIIKTFLPILKYQANLKTNEYYCDSQIVHVNSISGISFQQQQHQQQQQANVMAQIATETYMNGLRVELNPLGTIHVVSVNMPSTNAKTTDGDDDDLVQPLLLATTTTEDTNAHGHGKIKKLHYLIILSLSRVCETIFYIVHKNSLTSSLLFLFRFSDFYHIYQNNRKIAISMERRLVESWRRCHGGFSNIKSSTCST